MKHCKRGTLLPGETKTGEEMQQKNGWENLIITIFFGDNRY